MKNAKKSMFITTILMVAVLIVAVSTATFAWYTSSSTVTASKTQLSTATSDSANIAIGWTQSATTTEVSFEPASGLIPMVPTATFVVDTTTATDAAGMMTTGTLQTNAAGVASFKADGTGATPWTQAQYTEDDTAGATTLYLINYNTTKEANVTITMTATNVVDTPEVVNYFHLAVFAQEAGDTGVVYKGLLGTNAANYGEIDKDATALTNAGTIATSAVTITVPAANGASGGTVQIALVGWIDGVNLDNSLAGGAVSFTLSMSAAS